jgi:hypothetical protein
MGSNAIRSNAQNALTPLMTGKLTESLVRVKKNSACWPEDKLKLELQTGLKLELQTG